MIVKTKLFEFKRTLIGLHSSFFNGYKIQKDGDSFELYFNGKKHWVSHRISTIIKYKKQYPQIYRYLKINKLIKGDKYVHMN